MEKMHFIQVLLPLRLKWEPFYSYPASLYPRPVAGDRVRVEFGGKEYVGVVSNDDAYDEAIAAGVKRIKQAGRILGGLPRISMEEIGLWRSVADYYLCTVGEVYKAAYPAGKVEEEEVKARVSERLRERLSRKEEQIARARKEDTRERYIKERDAILAALDLRPVQAPDIPVGEPYRPLGPELSEAQGEAYSKIKELFKSGKTALLHGVTGSGKTEIYLKLARETLGRGRNVLYMVPEIALSRQLEERIKTHFPDELQVFHSAETPSRRIETGIFIRRRPYLVLGTRSSVFLPHRDLGLVIVDEEHDPSFKQDNPAPRYNGREAAIMLANLHGAFILLGSATPSLESLYNCTAGRYGKVILDKRYFDAADSDVEIIDTIAERKKNGMVGNFSRKLIERIRETLRHGGQVAILRERRSYSPVVQCQECGKILKCSRCDVALSLHRRPDGSSKLVCHHCGKVYAFNGVCPECGSSDLQSLGAGTQKIEEEAGKLFPQASIARLDSDNHKDEAGIIKKFSAGEIDILIGTRMVAKGFDFSGLSLVAVIQADSLLGQQDFRADERALQLLEQFRGRSGRRSEKGMFIIQTSQPDHPVYRTITGEDEGASTSNRFLAERKLFGYPPYSRVVNIVFKDYNASRVELMGEAFGKELRKAGLSAGSSIAGPFCPPVEMVSREHLRVIRVLLRKDNHLKANKELLYGCVGQFETDRKYHGHIALDVDPV